MTTSLILRIILKNIITFDNNLMYKFLIFKTFNVYFKLKCH